MRSDRARKAIQIRIKTRILDVYRRMDRAMSRDYFGWHTEPSGYPPEPMILP